MGLGWRTVELGDDGFVVRRLGRAQRVRWSSVTSVARTRGGSTSFGVRVHLQNGKHLDLEHSRRFGERTLEHLRRALAEHHAAYRARPTAVLPAAVANARGETSQRLRGALARGAAFRDATLTKEQLWLVIEDPAADQRARAAAAIAVAGALTQEDRGRIRAVAGRTVFPRLRVALTAVVDGANESTLDAELEALDAEDQKTNGISARRSDG
jgi:hypothetical protein